MKRADLALAFVAFVWGTTFVMVKGALGAITPLYFLALRFSVASVFLLPAVFWRNSAGHTHPEANVWSGLRAGGITGIFLSLGYILQTLGLMYTSAGNSGFLTSLYIVLVPLLGAVFFRRWPRRVELTGVAIAGVGIVLLTSPSTGTGLHLNYGDALTLLCAVAFAIHILVLGHYSRRERLGLVAFGQIATVMLICFAAMPAEHPHAAWTPGSLTAVLVTGIFATALAFFLQTWGQSHTTNTRAAVIFALEPVFALVTAVAIGGEHITIAALLGGALILAGVLLVELWGKRVDPQVEPAEEN